MLLAVRGCDRVGVDNSSMQRVDYMMTVVGVGSYSGASDSGSVVGSKTDSPRRI